ncbi:MAG: hypothetical protein M3Z02_05530 [Actinomycetota bacterium]|nr:hypothetical protein [Actinomycetota bacterium]
MYPLSNSGVAGYDVAMDHISSLQREASQASLARGAGTVRHSRVRQTVGQWLVGAGEHLLRP